jgi:type IV pilus assembly protein PilE
MSPRMKRPLIRGERGLTLIELMVALAIAVILMSVAVPSYFDQVRKGRRAEAQAVLMEASQFMERFATENLRYDRDRAGAAVALPVNLTKAPKEGSTRYYDVSLQSVGQDSFVLRAVPAGSHGSDACGTFTVDQRGVKQAARSDCWRR